MTLPPIPTALVARGAPYALHRDWLRAVTPLTRP